MKIGNTTSSSFLSQINQRLDKADEKLASGKRINSAADDAAGLLIANRLATQNDGLNQGIRNLYDGVSVAQVADSALSGINDNVERIRELTIQAGNGILGSNERSAIQQEINQLTQQVQDSIDNTSFAGQKLFEQDGALSFTTGSGEGEAIDVATQDVQAGLTGTGFFSVDVTSGDISTALTALDDTRQFVDNFRGDLGATINRFDSAISNISTQRVNQEAARSRIEDSDFAQIASQRVQSQILQQSSIAVQSQANANQQNVLSLLS